MIKKNTCQENSYNELLHQAVVDGSDHQITDILKNLQPAEIADSLHAMPRKYRPVLWQAVDFSVKGEVLTEVSPEIRQQLISVTQEPELLKSLATLEVDELADLDADLPSELVDGMVDSMDSLSRERYESVRFYPDDCAGGLMDVDAIVVRADVSLYAVLRYLRQLRTQTGQLPEHTDSLMVVDRQYQYLGVLKLSDLLSLPAKTMVSAAMTKLIPAIEVMMPATEVVQLFEDHDVLSASVVNNSGRLLGRITVDDVVDVMREEAEQEVMKRAGLHRSGDLFSPILSSASHRGIWLGVNLIHAFIASWIIGLFVDSIEKIVALAVLMPVVASMGGVAGNQTLTLITRGLALNHVHHSNARMLLMREMVLGLLNGLFWAAVVAGVAFLWFGDTMLGLVFGGALAITLLTGAFAGTILPIFLQRFGIDPALAGGVLLTAITDVVGFLSFLALATFLLL